MYRGRLPLNNKKHGRAAAFTTWSAGVPGRVRLTKTGKRMLDKLDHRPNPAGLSLLPSDTRCLSHSTKVDRMLSHLLNNALSTHFSHHLQVDLAVPHRKTPAAKLD